MAEGDLYLNCTNAPLSAEDLLRIVCVESDCDTNWFDCDNDEHSWEDLLRLLIREDASGNPAIAVCGCSGTASTGHMEFTTTLNQVAFDTTGTLTLNSNYKVFVDGLFQSWGHTRVGNVVTFGVPFAVGHEVSIHM